MEKVSSFFSVTLLALSLLIFLSSRSDMQARAQQLCLSQIALANQDCRFLIAPIPEEKLESQPELEASNEHHHHHHRIRRRRHHHSDPEDTPCCRRLKDIDDVCVCGVMTRLPQFVTRPKHTITLEPVEGCQVSFECGGIN